MVELFGEEGSRHTVEAFRYASKHSPRGNLWAISLPESINLIMGGRLLFLCQYKGKLELIWNINQNILGHFLLLLI